jgi:hypothetical protein
MAESAADKLFNEVGRRFGKPYVELDRGTMRTPSCGSMVTDSFDGHVRTFQIYDLACMIPHLLVTTLIDGRYSPLLHEAFLTRPIYWMRP